MVEKGKVIAVHYTGRVASGEIFDNTEGKAPLKFQVGSGQIIKGFENALIGKNIGDKVSVNLTSDEAYGQIREDLIVEVKKEQMPGEVTIGQSLSAQADNGQQINVLVKEVKEDIIIIDGNHPLAGKDISFEIEIVEIEDKEYIQEPQDGPA